MKRTEDIEDIRYQLDDDREGRVALGDYVDAPHGMTGRVTKIHHQCPEDKGWIGMQSPAYSQQELARERWVSVLVHNGGSICVTENRLRMCKKFKLNNSWAGFYFGKNR